MRCSVCGGTSFSRRPVLWNQLINDWQLSAEEIDYVNRQQGEACDDCGSNLRSIALANAIRAFAHSTEPLNVLVGTPEFKMMNVLEINEAGTLTPHLKQLHGHVLATYPAVDMHAIPYDSESFDIIVHSDTLEHVQNPLHALQECRRVMKKDGALCFTVPTIVGRLSRDRTGLSKSHHGDPKKLTDDQIVQTEFGSDAWTYAVRAGFTNVTICTVEFPAATALLCRNG